MARCGARLGAQALGKGGALTLKLERRSETSRRQQHDSSLYCNLFSEPTASGAGSLDGRSLDDFKLVGGTRSP